MKLPTDPKDDITGQQAVDDICQDIKVHDTTSLV